MGILVGILEHPDSLHSPQTNRPAGIPGHETLKHRVFAQLGERDRFNTTRTKVRTSDHHNTHKQLIGEQRRTGYPLPRRVIILTHIRDAPLHRHRQATALVSTQRNNLPVEILGVTHTIWALLSSREP